MSAGVRIVIALGAVALFLGLRLLALFKSDHNLLAWLAGGSHAQPIPVPVRRPEARRLR
jgi:hypothetical protein